MLTCGWPSGSQETDGWCGEPVSIAYLVQAHDVPLIDPNSEPKRMVLALCSLHDPAVADTATIKED